MSEGEPSERVLSIVDVTVAFGGVERDAVDGAHGPVLGPAHRRRPGRPGLAGRRRRGAALLTVLPNWTNDLAHSVSLSTRVSANLRLAIYGLVLMGAMIVWPSGIQGGLRVLGARLRGARGGPGAHSRSRAAAGS